MIENDNFGEPDFEWDTPHGMNDDSPCDEGYDDSMDGDHESGLRDAGLGTDEDYGDYGDYGDE